MEADRHPAKPRAHPRPTTRGIKDESRSTSALSTAWSRISRGTSCAATYARSSDPHANCASPTSPSLISDQGALIAQRTLLFAKPTQDNFDPDGLRRGPAYLVQTAAPTSVVAA